MITVADIGKQVRVISGPHGLDRISKEVGYFKDGQVGRVLRECSLDDAAPDYDRTFVVEMRDTSFTWYISAENLEVIE